MTKPAGALFERRINMVTGAVALAMVAYHLLYTQYAFLDPTLHSHTHLVFSLLAVYLVALKQETRKIFQVLLQLLIVFIFISALYVYVFYEHLLISSWFNTNFEIAIGIMLVFLSLEAVRKSFGLFIPVLAIAVVIYPFFGTHFSGPFHTTSYPPEIVVSNLSISLSGGLYDSPLYASATFVFLFVVFGNVLQGAGATQLFIQLGRLAGAKLRGGPAIIAVTSSALVGSVTGSVLANIAITGSFTIPLMKKVGYRPHEAGAIEVAASNGGQILPPVMGVTAFVMAGVTGISYLKICAMALLPALLYYLSVAEYIQLRAQKLRINPVMLDKIDIREMLLSVPLFVVPFGVIMVLLVGGFSVMYVAFWAILSVVITKWGITLVMGQRFPFLDLLQALISGGVSGAQIGVMTAAIGLITTTFTMSGMGVKLSAGIEGWSGGSLFFAMVIVAVVCTIMGCAGLAVVSYLVVAMFAAPAMMKMGVPLEHAHMFIMYPSVFALVTPPIALAAVVAARMANASYSKTAIESCKVSYSGFVLPFIFVYAPVLLLDPRGLGDGITGILSALIILFGSQIGFVGYCFTLCNGLERFLWFFLSASLFAFLVFQIPVLFWIGLGICVFLVLWQWRKSVVLAR